MTQSKTGEGREDEASLERARKKNARKRHKQRASQARKQRMQEFADFIGCPVSDVLVYARASAFSCKRDAP